ncbi:hypothetical protein CL629_01790 [bacterium]|nr:hypothetical protein [bacterium]
MRTTSNQLENTFENYLESIRKHFAEKEESEEIIEDIETSIAEKLITKRKNEKSAISISHVEDIIHAMGKPEDFEEYGTPEEPQTKTQNTRRLHRDSDDKIIAGVASGIAAYIGIDTTIVRLLFAISIFFGGFGVILYIILALIVPKAETTAQKLEMRGEEVTIAKISKIVEESVEKIKNRKNANKHDREEDGEKEPAPKKEKRGVLQKIFQIIGLIFKIIFEPIRIILGIALFISAVFSIAGITAATITLLVSKEAISMQPEVLAILNSITSSGTLSIILFIAAYLVILVPLLVIMLMGISILQKKNRFTTPVMLQLIFVWIVALTFAFALGAIHIPRIEQGIYDASIELSDSEKYEVKYENLDEFSIASLEGYNLKALIHHGDKQTITVLDSEEAHERTEIEVDEDNTLNVELERPYKFCFFFCPIKDGAEITITTPLLKELELSGNIEGVVTEFESDKIDISLSGATSLLASLKNTTTTFRASGASKIKLVGETKTLDMDLSGASHVSGYEFRILDAKITASGASSITANIENSLNTILSGASKLSYIGEAVNVTQEISGAGYIKQIPQEEAKIDRSFE